MENIVGVRFRMAGKIYYFSPGELELKRDDKVIVETSRGMEFGTVVFTGAPAHGEDSEKPIKPILRIATKEDMQKEKENLDKEKEAYIICKRKIREHELEMKLVNAEYTFDNSKLLFYFTADGRVDFRDLVKDLAGEFRTRIELRQIGVRDETKILGGMGICGRPLCCHTYLSDFAPVSIKMAKEQNLSLNPTKISGCCGRLMCCLQNEAETYEYLNSSLPKNGQMVQAEDGNIGKVTNVNILRQNIRILIEKDDEKELKEYHVSELIKDEDGKFVIDKTAMPKPKERFEPAIEEKADTEQPASPKQPQRKHNRDNDKDGGESRNRNNNRKDKNNRKNNKNRHDNRYERKGKNQNQHRSHNKNRDNRDNREHRDNRREKDGGSQ